QPGNGGGIALMQGISSKISITNSSFINCETISNSSDQRYGWGGAIFIQTNITVSNLNESNFLLTDLVFIANPLISIKTDDNTQHPNITIIDCEFKQDSSSYSTSSLSHSIISINGGQMSIIRTTIDNYKLSNENSYLMIKSDKIDTSEIYRINNIEIISSQFVSIEQSEGSGGSGIKGILNSLSKIIIKDLSKFERCICSQPGNGGALSLTQMNKDGKIEICNTSFIDCETISGTSSSSYGWGGAIYIKTQIDGSDLSNTNMILRSLKFASCSSVQNIGNNIHIQSVETVATGEAIENGNLLSVNGTINLYYNNSYQQDYMGIDESKVGDGTTINNNIPLFSRSNIYGGAICLNISFEGQVIISNSTFNQCEAQYGGGIFAQIQSGGRLTIEGQCKFHECITEQNGGAIDAQIYSSSILTIDGQCTFTQCTAQNSGGGISAQIDGENSKFVFGDDVLFDTCSSNFSGGLYANIRTGAQLIFEGDIKFKDCSASDSVGGGMFALCDNEGSLIQSLGELLFNNCSSSFIGGGAYIRSLNYASVELNKITCIDCKGMQGAGLNIEPHSNTYFAISGKASFTGCESQGSGGGILLIIFDESVENVEIQLTGSMNFVDCIGYSGGGMGIISTSIDSNIQITGELSFNNCSSNQGGGLYLQISNSSISFENIMQFKDCSSQGNGGGIYTSCSDEGMIEFIGELNFDNCSSKFQGGGGYFSINNKGQIVTNNITCNDCKSERAGGIFINSEDERSVIELSGIMTFVDCIGQNGGAIYAYINQGSLTINGSCFFTECESTYSGGALYLSIQNEATATIDNQCIFDKCTSESSGGAIFTYIQSGGILTVGGKCRFTECTTQGNGGGIFADIYGENSQLIIGDGVIFDNCSCENNGGGLDADIRTGSQLIFEGDCKFIDCSVNNNMGGGMFAWCYNEGSLIRSLGELLFDNCSSFNSGGGAFLGIGDKASIELNKVTCIDCKSDQGAGLNLQLDSNSYFAISGQASFTRCESQWFGGGIFFQILGENVQIQLTGVMEFIDCVGGNGGGISIDSIYKIILVISSSFTFQNCSGYQGGGMYILSSNIDSDIQITGQLSFDNCLCTYSGGGLSLAISGSKLSFENIIQFKDCSSQGNGGGIQASCSNEGVIKFIGELNFDNCQATNIGGGGDFSINNKGQIVTNNIITNECTAGDGGGIFINRWGESSIIELLGIMTFVDCLGLNGGGLYINAYNSGQVIISNRCTFTGCIAEQYGGALYASINQGSLTIEGACIFTECTSENSGGAIQAYISSGGILTVDGKCRFTECTSQGNGGGIFADIYGENSQLIIGDGVIFDTCSSLNNGGGLSTQIFSSAQLIFEGDCKFIDCSVNNHMGGGMFAWCYNEGSLIRSLGELLFDNCSCWTLGGGAFISPQDKASIQLNKVTCIDCKSGQGAGLNIQSASNTCFSISGQASFTRCASSGSGGGLCLINQEENAEIHLTGEMEFTDCVGSYGGGYQGGGIYISSTNIDSDIQITGLLSFDNCSCTNQGGGVYLEISGSQLSFENIIQFKDCSSQDSGGGIYVNCSDEGLIEFIGELNFDNCSSLYSGGGGYFYTYSKGQIVTNNIISNNCSASVGGGIFINSWYESIIKLSGIITFVDCIGQLGGGGALYVVINQGSSIIIEGACEFFKCVSQYGGGLYFLVLDEATVTIDGKCIFDQCTSERDGGAIYAIIDQGSLTIDGACIFTECKSESNGGGALYAYINQYSSFTIKGGCKFIQCSSQLDGGAILSYMGRDTQLTINECTFEECKSETYGGAVTIYYIDQDQSISIGGACIFDRCKSKTGGGALQAFIYQGSLTIDGQCIFTECTSESDGGAIAVDIQQEGSLNIEGACIFTECKSQNRGGALFISIQNETTVIIDKECIFKHCISERGGGAIFTYFFQGSLTIQGGCEFIQCSSQNIYNGGGAIFTYNYNDEHFSVVGCIFKECTSEGVGGAICIYFFDSVGSVSIGGACLFDNCSSYYDSGALFAQINQGSLTIDGACIFTECKSGLGGGGIYSNIYDSTLNIEDTTFDSCACTQPGNGGGISLYQGSSSIISITNSSFIDCKTISNSSDQRYGWGGAIFIQTSVTAENLNESNFLIRDLIFIGCEAVKTIGNNLHIQSFDTYSTGEAIEVGNLLSVDGTIDLYYNNIQKVALLYAPQILIQQLSNKIHVSVIKIVILLIADVQLIHHNQKEFPPKYVNALMLMILEIKTFANSS
ncbi:MAG: hypothetical protein EZS28_013534, partial [Streblomastix strix]